MIFLPICVATRWYKFPIFHPHLVPCTKLLKYFIHWIMWCRLAQLYPAVFQCLHPTFFQIQQSFNSFLISPYILLDSYCMVQFEAASLRKRPLSLIPFGTHWGWAFSARHATGRLTPNGQGACGTEPKLQVHKWYICYYSTEAWEFLAPGTRAEKPRDKLPKALRVQSAKYTLCMRPRAVFFFSFFSRWFGRLHWFTNSSPTSGSCVQCSIDAVGMLGARLIHDK